MMPTSGRTPSCIAYPLSEQEGAHHRERRRACEEAKAPPARASSGGSSAGRLRGLTLRGSSILLPVARRRGVSPIATATGDALHKAFGSPQVTIEGGHGLGHVFALVAQPDTHGGEPQGRKALDPQKPPPALGRDARGRQHPGHGPIELRQAAQARCGLAKAIRIDGRNRGPVWLERFKATHQHIEKAITCWLLLIGVFFFAQNLRIDPAKEGSQNCASTAELLIDRPQRYFRFSRDVAQANLRPRRACGKFQRGINYAVPLSTVLSCSAHCTLPLGP